MSANPTKLDPREEHFRILSPESNLELFLRYLPTLRPDGAGQRSVLYLHGATFPSAVSIAHRINGRSWRDALCDVGFDVWGLDFLGFGEADRYPEMQEVATAHSPLLLAKVAADQVAAAVRFIAEHNDVPAVSLITHSWASMPAGLFAAAHPTLVERIVMFAPLAQRNGPRYVPRPDAPAWKLVNLEDQWARFTEDVPENEPPVLSRDDFALWGEAYLDSDAHARGRHPPAVKTPTGPLVEILRAWHGELAWQPEAIQAPTCIIRGGWDGLVTDEDAKWLFDRLSRAGERRDVKIGRGTHLMHLEEMRTALWRESIAFLKLDMPAEHQATTRDKAMQDHRIANDLPGYNPGATEVAKSPISMEELNQIKASALFTDEDVVYLRLSYEVLKDQAEELVIMWRGIIAQHKHLASYGLDCKTGMPDKEYGNAVGKRFAQWVLDTARAEYDQVWLDYQYEIGLRHHRTKKNQTDHANAAPHIKGRDLIAFAAATVAPMRPYFEKGGQSAETVLRMQDAWWKSMILQVTLWSQPYMNQGDF